MHIHIFYILYISNPSDNQISQSWPKFMIWTAFHNLDQISQFSQFLPNCTIFTKFHKLVACVLDILCSLCGSMCSMCFMGLFYSGQANLRCVATLDRVPAWLEGQVSWGTWLCYTFIFDEYDLGKEKLTNLLFIHLPLILKQNKLDFEFDTEHHSMSAWQRNF